MIWHLSQYHTTLHLALQQSLIKIHFFSLCTLSLFSSRNIWHCIRAKHIYTHVRFVAKPFVRVPICMRIGNGIIHVNTRKNVCWPKCRKPKRSETKSWSHYSGHSHIHTPPIALTRIDYTRCNLSAWLDQDCFFNSCSYSESTFSMQKLVLLQKKILKRGKTVFNWIETHHAFIFF